MKLLKTILCASLLTTAVATQEVQAASGSGDGRMFAVAGGALAVGATFGVLVGYFIGRHHRAPALTSEQSPLLNGDDINGDAEAGRQGYGADGAAAPADGLRTPPRRGRDQEILTSPEKQRRTKGGRASPEIKDQTVLSYLDVKEIKNPRLASTCLKVFLDKEFINPSSTWLSTAYLFYVINASGQDITIFPNGASIDEGDILGDTFILEVKDNTPEALRVAGVFVEHGEATHQKIIDLLNRAESQ